MNQQFETLRSYLEKVNAYTAALALFQWDMETLAPKMAVEQTGKIVGLLTDEYYKTLICPEVKALLEELEQVQEGTLAREERAIIRELRRTYDQLETIPKEEYRAFSELTLKSSNVWAKAREDNQYEDFAPMLQEIIEYKKRFASYRKKEHQKAYDVLLSDFEPSLSMKELDAFFELIKQKLVPVVLEVEKRRDKIDDSFQHRRYPIEKQREFCHFLGEYIGFDFDKGVMAESAHPFTTNLHNKDVRITNHFDENQLFSAIFSVIHETGHAIYEMNIADSITQTIVGSGASMAMHESQSRFYENMIGKQRAFWEPIYPKLQELFYEQLKDVSLNAFYLAINKAEPSLIRIDADELTYPLHILVRYEIEKMIFEGEVSVSELPKVWNEKYKEYLHLEPDCDAKGVLQDTHWSWGEFGYFPSYAIGSAVAAQIYHHLKQVMDYEEVLRKGNLRIITKYLKESIHQYGMVCSMNELLLQMTGEEFNPNYYIEYLVEKYESLYLK